MKKTKVLHLTVRINETVIYFLRIVSHSTYGLFCGRPDYIFLTFAYILNIESNIKIGNIILQKNKNKNN